MRCAISQPAFLPWLGWFDIAEQADLMVLLDTVQFAKRSWQQRNRIRTAKGLEFVTVPVKTSGRFEQTIREVEIADAEFGERMLRQVHAAYARSPYYKAVRLDLEAALGDPSCTAKLADLNLALIRVLLHWLKVETPLRLASELQGEGRRGAYLASLCSCVGADAYLSTAGAEEYLRMDASFFHGRNVAIFIHEYTHPHYRQLHDPFLSHASALDLVMMHGHASSQILREAGRRWRALGPLLPQI